MSAYDAYRAARFLAAEGRDSDAVSRADIDAAADLAGANRPTTTDERHVVRLALDAISGPL